jgi:hypothetical protein
MHPVRYGQARPAVCVSRSGPSNRLVLIAALTLAAGGTLTHAQAPAADVVLINGKVVTLDDASSIVQAIAIRDGRVLALGSDEDIRRRVDGRTHIIDLASRTAVPGLMDSHIHALRAGLTYSVELSWIGVPSLAKGLDLISRGGTHVALRRLDQDWRRLDRIAVSGKTRSHRRRVSRRGMPGRSLGTGNPLNVRE